MQVCVYLEVQTEVPSVLPGFHDELWRGPCKGPFQTKEKGPSCSEGSSVLESAPEGISPSFRKAPLLPDVPRFAQGVAGVFLEFFQNVTQEAPPY